LPVVGVIALGLWYLLPTPVNGGGNVCADYGLWHLMPSFLQEGYWAIGLSALGAVLGVYLMTELNNAYILLRVSSRMIGSTYALLVAITVVCHRFQPGSIVALLSLLSFFPLFVSYQLPNPRLSFMTHLLVSLASLVFPKMLFLVPIYWLLQGFLRAFSFRCFMASLLAVLLPYWFYGGLAFALGFWSDFTTQVSAVFEVQWFDYSQLDGRHFFTFGFLVLLFLSGAIDFYHNRFLDKARIRTLYNVVILHGGSIMLTICLFPQFFSVLVHLLLIDTAIVFGHFFTLTHTLFSHIYNIVLLLLALVVVAAQYVLDASGFTFVPIEFPFHATTLIPL